MVRITKHIDFRNGAFGCGVSFLFMLFFVLLVAMTGHLWLALLPITAFKAVQLLAWLVAIFFGGYAAVWKAMTPNWTSALAVGLLAELFLVLTIAFSRSPESVSNAFIYQTSQLTQLTDLMSQLIDSPQTHWYALTLLACAIPAAILGGLLRIRTSYNPLDDLGR